jgi:hypothetical protein
MTPIGTLFWKHRTSQSPNIRLIDLNRMQVYEAGAMLVAFLAYPGDSVADEERRSQLYGALCACMLQAMCDVDPDWASSPQSIKPIYAALTERDCNRSVRSLARLLRDRMVAARMAYPFLKEAESGEPFELPASLKRLSLNQMAELVLTDARYSDPENVETRIWRPSRPVIHLASAVHGYLHLLEPVAELLGFVPLMTDPIVLEYVVRSAEYGESLVAKSRRLRINPETLIKIRLAQRG